jgi:hypothetical protein
MSGPDPSPEFVARAKRFWFATNRPMFRARILGMGMGVLVVVVVIASIVVVRDPRFAIATSIVMAAIAVGVTLLPFREQRSRLAAELVRDHEAREAKEWRAAFGAPLPCTRKDSERWLAEHPHGPGRASILIGLGRLDEAERELDSGEPVTPMERFDASLQRSQIAAFRGQEPDIAGLRAKLADLAGPRDQAAKRQCIVAVQAWHAAERGEDALAVLARGRRVIGLLDPACAIERQMLRLVRFPLFMAGSVVVGVGIGLS